MDITALNQIDPAHLDVHNQHVNPFIRRWLVGGAIGWEEMLSLMEREPEFIANLCAELDLRSFAALREMAYPLSLEAETIAKAYSGTQTWNRAQRTAEWDAAMRPLADIGTVIVEQVAKSLARALEVMRTHWHDRPR